MSVKWDDPTWIGGAISGTDLTVGLSGGANKSWTFSQVGTYVLSLLDSDLTAIASNSTNGIYARTGSGTVAARTITGTANEITVTNGDGVSGNPTLSIPTAVTLTGKTLTGGIYSSVSRLESTGRLASGNTIYAVADATISTNSVGLEMAWLGATSRIQSYSRAASTFQPLQLSASAITLNIAGTDIIAAASTGATVTGTLAVTSWIKSGSFTVGTVPSASSAGAGAQIYVSNESGGAVTAFSDGTNWRRSTDRTIIS